MINKTTAILALVLLVIGSVAGFAFGRSRYKSAIDPLQAAFVRQGEVIGADATQIAPGQIVALGDSIVERERLTQLCGLDVLNAGISSAKVDDIAKIAAPAALIAKPSRIVLAVGINDLVHKEATSYAAMTSSYRAILDRFPSRPIIVGVGKVPDKFGHGSEQINAFLQQQASARQGIFVPALGTDMLFDGIHPNAVGRRAWIANVEKACASG